MEDQKLDEHEENFIDPGEDDDDYDPDDEDSIDSEEEATSADEEYTPTPTRAANPIPTRTNPTTTTIWKKPATGQVLRQGGELSEYEKIREANIREKEQMLRSLQGDWQEFKRSEGLAVGGSQRGAKKILKVVDKDPVTTRTTTRKSSLPDGGGGTQGDQRQPNRVPGEVGDNKIAKKGRRGALVNCEQCGEEVRGKNMLKEHIKFYHPKVKAQKPSQKAGKPYYGYQTPNDPRVNTNASMVRRGAKLQSMEDVRTREAKRKSLEDPFFSNFMPASTSGQSTMASGEVSREARKQIMVDPLFANININPVPVPPTPDQEIEELEELENLVKELEPVEADMELCFPGHIKLSSLRILRLIIQGQSPSKS